MACVTRSAPRHWTTFSLKHLHLAAQRRCSPADMFPCGQGHAAAPVSVPRRPAAPRTDLGETPPPPPPPTNPPGRGCGVRPGLRGPAGAALARAAGARAGGPVSRQPAAPRRCPPRPGPAPAGALAPPLRFSQGRREEKPPRAAGALAAPFALPTLRRRPPETRARFVTAGSHPSLP